MSSVYEAEDSRSGLRVAVKVMTVPEFLPPDELQAFVTRLRREARMIARLSHPNIVKVIDHQEEDNSAYLVMEYIEGITLAQQIARIGPLPFADAASLLKQVASAIDATHAAGIVHRDLKPSNIMLLPDKTQEGGFLVKILDFGIARSANEATMTKTGTFLGTPAYIAPELVRGAKATAASDLWAVGVLLYEMLTAKPPFSGELMPSVLYKIVHDTPENAPGLPFDLQELLFNALEKDPAKRFSSGQTLVESLDAVLKAIPEKRLGSQEATQALPILPATTRPVGIDRTLLQKVDGPTANETTASEAITQQVTTPPALPIAAPAVSTPLIAVPPAAVLPAIALPTSASSAPAPAAARIFSAPHTPVSAARPAAKGNWGILVGVLLFLLAISSIAYFASQQKSAAPAVSHLSPPPVVALPPDHTLGTNATGSISATKTTRPKPRDKRLQQASEAFAKARKEQAARTPSRQGDLLVTQEHSPLPTTTAPHRENAPVGVTTSANPAKSGIRAKSHAAHSKPHPIITEDAPTIAPPMGTAPVTVAPEAEIQPNGANADSVHDDAPAPNPAALAAADATQEELQALLSDWVESLKTGDIIHHMTFYPARLEHYYARTNVARDDVQTDKERVFGAAKKVMIKISDLEINIAEDGKSAVMLFRRNNNIVGGPGARQGTGRTELQWRLMRPSNDWKIVSERNAEPSP